MHRDIIKEDCDQFVRLISDNKLEFNSLIGKTILITGGTGFFGKWLLTTFLYMNSYFNLNARCVVLTRNSNLFLERYPEFGNSSLSFIDGDVRNFEVDESKFDFIIHAATPASATLEREYPEEMKSIIEDGTKHVIEIAKKCNTTKILFTSSGGVYGSAINNRPFIENDECKPTSIYGKAKLISENMLLNSGINTVVARCFAFVGPYLELDIHYAIGNFIKDSIEGKDIKINGDGTPVRSYMYSLDLMYWLWTLLLKGEENSIYNVGSNRPISILELANLVSKRTNSKVYLSKNSNKEIIEPRSFYIPDTSKADVQLGLHLAYGLDASIERTMIWNVENR